MEFDAERALQLVLIGLAAYLLGSISFAILVSRWMRLPDPRSYGSGNPGATNVLRTGKRGAAALTLLGDVGKGWLAVWLAALYAGGAAFSSTEAAVAAVAVFLGHLYPVFYRFQGGKGVATAAGVLLALNLWLGVGVVLTWAAIAACFRYSSLAALVAAVFAPLYAAWLFGLAPLLPAVLMLSLLLIWRHRVNIQRLVAGTESRIGHKRSA